MRKKLSHALINKEGTEITLADLAPAIIVFSVFIFIVGVVVVEFWK